MDRSDEQIAADYLRGDKESLEILIKRCLRPIYGFAYRYAGNGQDAEDITQETFVKVWRNLKKFDRNKSFKTWIFSIAKNTAIDFLKKSRTASGGKKVMPFSEFPAQGASGRGGENKESENYFENTLRDFSPLPNELAEQTGIRAALAAIIEKLSPKYQMVLFLHYNDHFNFREIAESLGEPLDTIKSRHRRAIIMMRKLLIGFQCSF